MLIVNVLSKSKCLPRPGSFNLIRAYCQNHDVKNTVKSIDNHESKLIAELNKLDLWESYKHLLTEKKFNLIQKWKIENGGFITNFDDISKIKGMNKKTVDKLREFCESRVQDDRKNSSNTDIHYPHETQKVHFNVDIWPNSFGKKDSFILYDETIAPNDSKTTKQSLYTENNSFSDDEENPKAIKLVREPKLAKFPSVRSFTVIDLNATSISYIHFSADSIWNRGIKIDAWKHFKIRLEGMKNLYQMCDQLSQVVEQMPESDIYILDDVKETFHKAVTPKRNSEIVQINQQYAILFTLFQNKMHSVSSKREGSNVFFMTYNIVERLYDLPVECDSVSKESTIRDILNNSGLNIGKSSIPIEFDDDLKNNYFKSNQIECESLGKAMLIGLAFIRLSLLKK